LIASPSANQKDQQHQARKSKEPTTSSRRKHQNYKELVPTYDTPLTPDKPINTVAIKRISIYPSETTTVGLQVPHMRSKTLSNFKKQNLPTDAIEENINSDRLEILPTLTRLRKSELQVVVKNNSNEPIQINEGMDFA